MKYRIIEKGSCYRAQIKYWWGWGTLEYFDGKNTWHTTKEAAIKQVKKRIEKLLWRKLKPWVVDSGTVKSKYGSDSFRAAATLAMNSVSSNETSELDHWIDRLLKLKELYGADARLVIMDADKERPVDIKVSYEYGKYVLFIDK